MLGKSWRKFKLGKWHDDELTMAEARQDINKIQTALEIPVTNFAAYRHEYTKEENFQRQKLRLQHLDDMGFDADDPEYDDEDAFNNAADDDLDDLDEDWEDFKEE